MTPNRKRRAVGVLRDRFGVSQRRACTVVGIHRSTMHLTPPPTTAEEAELRAWLRRFSTDLPRWGWRRAAKMTRRAGWQVNNKRIRRLWREEGLRVPQRRREKRLTGIGVAVGAMSPIRPNVIRAMDFPFDTTADGRTLKMLNVIDEFTREALAIEVYRCIDADGVVAVLDRLTLKHGAPVYVRFDNGPEFIAPAVGDWCRFNSAGSLFIDPGSPWQNAWVESFNGRLRDELLNSWRFDSLLEARVMIEDWRRDYKRQQAPLRPRRAHPSRVRSTVDHDPPTPSRIATGPTNGSPSKTRPTKSGCGAAEGSGLVVRTPLAPVGPGDAGGPHVPGDLIATDVVPGTSGGLPELAGSVDLVVAFPELLQRRTDHRVSACPALGVRAWFA